MKKITYLISFIFATTIISGVDVEKKPFVEHAKAVHGQGKNTHLNLNRKLI
ncbi:MAG: hypothetical protein AAF546_13845 [Verrucomicrobiota bacterium]